MNYIYIGKSCDLNIGNGKTSSAVGAVVSAYLQNPERKIYSNIELTDIPFSKFSPSNIMSVLETENAIVLLDEIHAIVHKNHRIIESCKHHSIIGLCYLLSEFFRQVRKRGIDTYSTAQTFEDCPFQYRQLMNMQIVCEKYHLEDGKLKKCTISPQNGDKCPEEHRHFIKQTYYPSNYLQPVYFDPEPYYSLYNSFEIVQGWVS